MKNAPLPTRAGTPGWVLWARALKPVSTAWDKLPAPPTDENPDPDEEFPIRGLAAVLYNLRFPMESVAEILRYRMDLPADEAADPEDRAAEIADAMWSTVFGEMPSDPMVNLNIMDPAVVRNMTPGVTHEVRLGIIARYDQRVRAAMWVDARDNAMYWHEDDEPVNRLLEAAAYFHIKRVVTGATPVNDRHLRQLCQWTERVYAVPGRVAVADLADAFPAMLPIRHPIQERLLRIEAAHPACDTDGALLDTWLCRVFGAEDTRLTRAFSRKWLIQAVARAFEPGCTAKGVLSLVGMQDAGKSTALERLAYDWAVTLPTDLGDKDSRLNCHRGWIIELAELAGLKKASIEAVKTFLSEKVDTMRAPYKRASVSYPRSFVFATTTNDVEFLRDNTGNVRYWIVRVLKRVDFNDLMAIRDQLWAAAVRAYQADVERVRAAEEADQPTSDRAWYLTEDERAMQAVHNADFEPEDESGARIRSIALRLASVSRRPLAGAGGATHYVTTNEVWRELQAAASSLGGASAPVTAYASTGFARQVSAALVTTQGPTWKQVRVLTDGVMTRYYLPPAEWLAQIHATQAEARALAQELSQGSPGMAALLANA